MAKKFVRGITGVKDIKKQPLSTTNVNDLVSDGKDIYVHRKKEDGGEEYFNLTKDEGSPVATGADSGLTSWKADGKTNLQLSEEFLQNNAQYLEGTDGITATSRQDKYGKSYTFKLSDDVKAKLDKPAGTNIVAGNGIIKKHNDTNNTDTISVNNKVFVERDRLRGKNPYIYWEDDYEWDEMSNKVDTVALHLDENYYLTRRNLQTADNCGIVYTDKRDLDSQFSTLDVDSTKLLRHDCLLSAPDSGIKIYHNEGESTSAVSLTDDVKAKLAKVDSLSAGGNATTVKNTDGNLKVTQDGNNVTINMSAKATQKANTIGQNVEEAMTKVHTVESNLEILDLSAIKSITSPTGTISTTPIDNGYKLDVDKSHVLVHDNLQAGSGVTVTHNQDHTITTVAVDESIAGLGERVTTLENNATRPNLAPDPKKYLLIKNLLADEASGLIKQSFDGDAEVSLMLDNTVLLQHKHLLGDAESGITVTHANGSTDTTISLAPDIKTKLAKLDKVNIPEDGSIQVAPVTITSTLGSLDVTKDGDSFTIDVNRSKVGEMVTPEVDKLSERYLGTTVEAPLTKSYNNTPTGKTINIGLSTATKSQLAKIATLEATIADLTKRLEALEAK